MLYVVLTYCIAFVTITHVHLSTSTCTVTQCRVRVYRVNRVRVQGVSPVACVHSPF